MFLQFKVELSPSFQDIVVPWEICAEVQGAQGPFKAAMGADLYGTRAESLQKVEAEGDLSSRVSWDRLSKTSWVFNISTDGDFRRNPMFSRAPVVTRAVVILIFTGCCWEASGSPISPLPQHSRTFHSCTTPNIISLLREMRPFQGKELLQEKL